VTRPRGLPDWTEANSIWLESGFEPVAENGLSAERGPKGPDAESGENSQDSPAPRGPPKRAVEVEGHSGCHTMAAIGNASANRMRLE
jgi:hypothetical protein